jgi:hypothetical protein
VANISKEARVRQTSGHPILVNGLIYGVLIVLISIATNVLDLVGVKISDVATSLVFTGVVLLVELALFFLAGRGASARTGTVGAGALAGLLAAAIAGVIGAVLSIARAVVDPGAIRDAALKVNPSANPSLYTDQFILITSIVGAVVGLLFLLGIGAGAGAIGGLLGRGRYQPSTYQESMYQGLPPQPPLG